ncbi:MAG: type 4a pilus biogenesis protein PilO [Actinomycetota bacterium]
MTRNPLVSALLVAIAVVAFLFAFLLPKGAEIGEVQQRIAAEEQVLLARQAELATLQALDPAALSAELQRYRAAIPSTADLPRLLRDLTVAAATAGVRLTGVTPSNPQPAAAAAASAITLSLNVQGSYFELAEFIFELEHLERLGKISSLSLSPGGEGNILSLQLTSEVYTTDTSSGPSSDPLPGPEVGA